MKQKPYITYEFTLFLCFKTFNIIYKGLITIINEVYSYNSESNESTICKQLKP